MRGTSSADCRSAPASSPDPAPQPVFIERRASRKPEAWKITATDFISGVSATETFDLTERIGSAQADHRDLLPPLPRGGAAGSERIGAASFFYKYLLLNNLHRFSRLFGAGTACGDWGLGAGGRRHGDAGTGAGGDVGFVWRGAAARGEGRGVRDEGGLEGRRRRGPLLGDERSPA